MDVCGPFVTSYQGNKYLLTFQDAFTKYVEAFPMPDQKSETIAKIFVTEIISRHGTPKQLLTDQGTNFISKLMKDICKLLQIEKLQTTPFHPQSNGMIERSHRVFKDVISHYVSRSQQDWDSWIPYVLMSYRFNIHSATGYTPFLLLYGRDPIFPFDDIIRPQSVKYDSDHNYVSELLGRLNNVYTTVRENLKTARDKQTYQYNKKSKDRNFYLGQLVYLHDPAIGTGLSKKLTKPWKGPYRIIEIKGPVTYRVKKLNSHKEVIVHANRLKPCSYDNYSESDQPTDAIPKLNLEFVEESEALSEPVKPADAARVIIQGFGQAPVQPVIEEPPTPLGTEIREGVRVSNRPHRPPKRFTFSEFD